MDDEQVTFQTPDGGAKIGPILEKARKERGLTLEEVEHATKIRKRYLVGLEREDYGVLPDAVYAQGFLKTYANHLGLDGEELARELRDRRRPRRERGITYGPPKTSEFDRPLINPGELAKTRRGKRVSGTTIFTLLVALLTLSAVVGSLYYVGRGVQETSGPSPNPSQPSEGEAADGPKPEADRGQALAKGAGKERDASGNVKGAGGSDKAASEPQPDSLRVEVSVEGSPSWLSILADGNLAYEQIAQPGFAQTFEAQREISIKTGNAGAVGVEVNGQDLGKLGESGEVLTRDFTLKSAT
jgi:cytoskeleton protein RodZ